MDAVFQRVMDTRPSLSHFWNAIRSVPGGPNLFSRLIAQLSPHTSTLGAKVSCLEEGLVEVVVKTRRSQCDMNGDVHPAVLVNLAELTTGLAIRYVSDRRGDARLSRISLEVLDSARGELFATCEDTAPRAVGRHAPTMRATIRDSDGVVVAYATALWEMRIYAGG